MMNITEQDFKKFREQVGFNQFKKYYCINELDVEESLKFSTDAHFMGRTSAMTGLITNSSGTSNKSHSMDCKSLLTVDGAYDKNHERYDFNEK